MKGPAEAVDTPDPQRRAHTDLPPAVGVPRLLGARPLQPPLPPKPPLLAVRHYRVGRKFGKHDTADAEAAVRALQANTATGEPKGADGPAEIVRALHVVWRSAVKARTQAANQLRAARYCARRKLKAELRDLFTAKLVATAERFRPGGYPKDLRAATRLVMRSVATGGFPRR
jgi:transposase